MTLDIPALISKISDLFPNQDRIALSEPHFAGNEWQYVKECIDTGWVSSVGQYVDQIEHRLAELTGAKYAIATVNGTAALHISLILAGVKADDEVLVPALTFVATSNAVSYCAATPHFVDVDTKTLGVDPVRLDEYLAKITETKNNVCINQQTGRPIRALMVMHTFGHAADLDVLEAICKKYHLALVEDAAEALGTHYKSKHVGHRGIAGALSFNGNKIITTGGGGAILCDDQAIAQQAKHLTTTAKLKHPWHFNHDQVGYNYRMPNLNAALGCAQLERLPSFLEAKRVLAEQYLQAFQETPGVTIFREPEFSHSNYWLNTLLLDSEVQDLRNEILQAGKQQNIQMRPVWTLQPKLPMYQDCPTMPLPVAEALEQSIISLPSSVLS